MTDTSTNLAQALRAERDLRILGQQPDVHWESLRDLRRAVYTATDEALAAHEAEKQDDGAKLAGTAPRANYVKAARVYALAYGRHDDAPGYLPRTQSEADVFEPHAWVIGAMMQAFVDGWSDGHAAGIAFMKAAAEAEKQARCQSCGDAATRNVPEEATSFPGPYCSGCGPGVEKQAGPVAVQAPAPGDERAGFEARFPKPDELTWNGTGYDCEEGYENSYALNAYCAQWRAWQARALATAPPSPLAEQDKVDADTDMASPDYQAGWNAAMDAMTKAMTRVETLDAIRAARAKKEQS